MLIVNFLHAHEFEDFRFFSDWNNQKSGGLHNIARLFDWSGESRNRVPTYWDSTAPGKGYKISFWAACKQSKAAFDYV